jgi:hypothetical protein
MFQRNIRMERFCRRRLGNKKAFHVERNETSHKS